MSLLEKLFGVKDDPLVLNTSMLREAARNMAQAQAQMDVASYQGLQNAQYAQHQQGMWFSAASSYPPQTEKPLRGLADGDLDHPAGQASLDELTDFWVTRWQHKWVRRTEIEDDFYTIAAIRLLSGGYLEAHELSSGARVYRLIERK